MLNRSRNLEALRMSGPCITFRGRTLRVTQDLIDSVEGKMPEVARELFRYRYVDETDGESLAGTPKQLENYLLSVASLNTGAWRLRGSCNVSPQERLELIVRMAIQDHCKPLACVCLAEGCDRCGHTGVAPRLAKDRAQLLDLSAPAFSNSVRPKIDFLRGRLAEFEKQWLPQLFAAGGPV